MNAKDRYNEIIATIEKGAMDPHTSADDVMFMVVRGFGLESRELNGLIRFMTGDTLLYYIKSRKLMAAYKSLLDANSLNIRRAVDISGFDNQSSFTKKFTSHFGFSPKEAFKRKDYSLYAGPSNWEVVSCDLEHISADKSEAVLMEEKQRFGISQEQYDRVIEAHELANLYNLPPLYSEMAFELSEQLGIELKLAFRYAQSIQDFFGVFSPEKENVSMHIDFGEDVYIEHDPAKRLREVAYDPYIRFIFFECKLSVSTAYDFEERIPMDEEEIMQLDPELLFEYAHVENMSFRFFEDAFNYYKKNADNSYSEEDFEYYLDLLYQEVPKEIAFANIVPIESILEDVYDEKGIGLDTFYEDNIFERMDEENSAWRNVRIDIELDEENASYEFEDLCDAGFLDF